MCGAFGKSWGRGQGRRGNVSLVMPPKNSLGTSDAREKGVPDRLNDAQTSGSDGESPRRCQESGWAAEGVQLGAVKGWFGAWHLWEAWAGGWPGEPGCSLGRLQWQVTYGRDTGQCRGDGAVLKN